jgi:uncharacterized protein YkwD
MIQKGDTLWKLSLKYHLHLQELLDANQHLHNPQLIFPGDIIYIPSNTIKKISREEEKLIQLINNKRFQVKLPPLVHDQNLSDVAKQKSLDMMRNQYVAHKSPEYGYPTLMLKKFQIDFRSVKENVGAGPNKADEIFDKWMNSYLQREVLLDKSTTHIGVGHVEGGLHRNYWSALMIRRN